MASVIEKSHLPVAFHSNESDFPSLIKWVKSIPASNPAQDYLAIAAVIEQEIEPIISEKAPQITMQGNVLSSEITQSKGFIYQREKVLSSILDPTLLSLLNSEIPINESIVHTKTKQKVDKLGKVILLICRTDGDQSTLEYFCQGAIQEINRIKATINGSFSISAQALISDSPSFSRLTNSEEPCLLPNALEINQSIDQSIEMSEQSILALDPREGLILERHFDHGEREETNTELLVALENGQIVTTTEKSKVETSFIGLKYESEEFISLEL